jgi:hypothetical protein
MSAKPAAEPAGAQNAGPPANAAGPALVTVAPAAGAAAGFAAHHPLPPGFIRLVCPPGAETASISAVGFNGEAFREHGPGRGRWLFDCPAEAARHLMRGGFYIFDPAASS